MCVVVVVVVYNIILVVLTMTTPPLKSPVVVAAVTDPVSSPILTLRQPSGKQLFFFDKFNFNTLPQMFSCRHVHIKGDIRPFIVLFMYMVQTPAARQLVYLKKLCTSNVIMKETFYIHIYGGCSNIHVISHFLLYIYVQIKQFFVIL